MTTIGQNSIPEIPVLKLNKADTASLVNDMNQAKDTKKTTVYDAQAELNSTEETVVFDGVYYIKTVTTRNLDGLETSVVIEYYSDEDLKNLNSEVEYKYEYDSNGKLTLETMIEVCYDSEGYVISSKKTESKFVPETGLSSKYTTENYYNHAHVIGMKEDTFIYDEEGKRILDVTKIYDSLNNVNWTNE